MNVEGMRYLSIREDEQSHIREEIGDDRICWGFNQKKKEYQVWYRPENSRPYKITTADNMCHAIYTIRSRQRFEKMRAKDLLAEIDAYNEKLLTDKEKDAMHEVRHTMKNVANGRQIFPPPLRRSHANV